MALRVLIVDDDERERIVLRYIIEQMEDVQIIGEASNGIEGVMIAKDKKPDLIFFDIFMAELNGIEAAKRIKEMPDPPLFAFITLHPERAVDAFDIGALDYIVKPMEPGRIYRTVDRAKKWLAHEQYLEHRVEEKLREKINRTMKILRREGLDYDRLPIKERGKITLINQEEIIYAESQGKKVILYTEGEEYATSYTLSELEERLDSNQFFRVHQAFIVNLDRIKEINVFGEGSYVITLDHSKKQIVMSRSRAKILRQKLGL